MVPSTACGKCLMLTVWSPWPSPEVVGTLKKYLYHLHSQSHLNGTHALPKCVLLCQQIDGLLCCPYILPGLLPKAHESPWPSYCLLPKELPPRIGQWSPALLSPLCAIIPTQLAGGASLIPMWTHDRGTGRLPGRVYWQIWVPGGVGFVFRWKRVQREVLLCGFAKQMS